MNREIDDLLNSLMKDIESAEKRPPEQTTRSTASKEARQRVEAILRDVEEQSPKQDDAPPEPVREPMPDLPVHEPVTVPPTVSHFTEEPSADLAVRMRDRLEENALPAPDAERKPTQNHGLKPRLDRSKRRKYKPRAESRSIPQPHVPPKKVIPHIEVPDELPPDIVPSPGLHEEPAQVALERAVSGEDTASAMIAVLTKKPEEPAEPVSAETEARREVVRSKAEMIREQLRRRAEEEQEEPEEPAAPQKPSLPENYMPAPEEVFPEDAEEASSYEYEEPEEEPEETASLTDSIKFLFGRVKDFVATKIFEEVDEEDEAEEDEEPEDDYLLDDSPYEFDAEEDETLPAEEPVEEPEEDLIEEPAEEPIEEPAEELIEEPAEEPIEEPAEEPIEEPEEESEEEPVQAASAEELEEALATFTQKPEPKEEPAPDFTEAPELPEEPASPASSADEEAGPEETAGSDDPYEWLYEEPIEEVPEEGPTEEESAPKLRHLAEVPEEEPVKGFSLKGLFASLLDKLFEPAEDDEEDAEDDEYEDDDEEYDDDDEYEEDGEEYEEDDEEYEDDESAYAEPSVTEASPAEAPEEDAPAEEPHHWTHSTAEAVPEDIREPEPPRDYTDFSGDRAADEAYLALTNPEEAEPLPNPPMPEIPQDEETGMQHASLTEEEPAPEPEETPEAPKDDFDAEEYAAFAPPPRAPEEQPEPSKKYTGFRAALREALDESAGELADMKTEPVPEQEAQENGHYLARNSYFVAGVVCAVLAVVGLVTCVSGLLSWLGGFAGGGSIRDEITDVLYPVAVTDMPAFEQVGDIDDTYFLGAAMMDILMYDDLSGYPVNFDVITIPLQDVLLRARRMFGAEYSPVPVTLHLAGETFYYDEDIHSYNVPQSPAIFSYAPEIRHIQRSGDVYTVDVTYKGDTAQWQSHSGNYPAQNVKDMQVVLEKKNGVWRIVRISNTGETEQGQQ